MMLKENLVSFDNGNEVSDAILQTKGVLQGDSLSPTLFIVYASDLPQYILEPETDCLMYADDLVIFSENIDQLRTSIRKLEEWCSENKLQINKSKTKILKFRNGGKLKRTDEVSLDNSEIEFVNTYEYLGLKLQTTKKMDVTFVRLFCQHT